MAVREMLAVVKDAFRCEYNGAFHAISHAIIHFQPHCGMFALSALRNADLPLQFFHPENLFIERKAAFALLHLEQRRYIEGDVFHASVFCLDLLQKSGDAEYVLKIHIHTQIHPYPLIGEIMHSTQDNVIIMLFGVVVIFPQRVVLFCAVQ